MSVGEKETLDETAPAADGAAEGQAPVDGENGSEPEVVALAPELVLTAEEQEIAALREQLTQAQQAQDQSTARLRAVSKAYTDLQAENKSFKERMEQRAKLDSELQAFEQVRAFFEPVMNLRRSLLAAGEGGGPVFDGLRMVEQQFMDALHKLGLTEVPGVGSRFDPNMHEALGVTPVADAEQDGKVLVVHTTGFAVGSRVLQAAQVVIGKHEEAAGEA